MLESNIRVKSTPYTWNQRWKKYKLITDWEGGLYIEIALKWDYEKRPVQLSMPGYVLSALHDFQHEKPKWLQDSP